MCIRDRQTTTGDKLTSRIQVDETHIEDNSSSSASVNYIYFIQIPIAIVVIGLVILTWRYIKKKRNGGSKSSEGGK